ncbi:hypothetical protein BH11MYX3_BH11MYX3_27780 [soil metagenome]
MQESPDDDAETQTDPSLTAPQDAPRHVNSVDATTGQPLVARVTARKAELEALLAALPLEEINVRGDIGLALSTINDLLTGDLEHVPSVVAVDMNRWLERSKHVAETATHTTAADAPAPVEPALASP